MVSPARNRLISVMIAMAFVLVPLSSVSIAGPAEEENGPAPPSEALAPGDWPRFRLNTVGNPVIAGSGPGFGEDQEYWSNTTAGNIYASPVIADGRLFIGSTNGKLYCMDADSGEELWNNQTGVGDYGVSSTAAVANGYVVVFSNGDDDLYSFNVSTGERRWKADLGSGGYGGSSPLIYNGKVYVGSPNGRMYVRNEVTGAADWDYQIGASGSNGYGVESSPSIADNMVIFSGGDDKVRAVNITTHNLEWEYPLQERGYTSPAIVDGVVYTADGRYSIDTCANCRVYALDLDGLDDGNDGWTGEASTGATDGDVIWQYTSIGPVISSPAVSDGYVFIGSEDHKFYALNASDGTLEWSYTTGGDVSATPAVADGIVYIASYDDKVYGFDVDGFSDGNDGWTGESSTGATDGDIIWNFTLSGDVWSSPAISNGLLYIADLSNKVWSIGIPSVDNNPPTVSSTDPADLEVDVALDKTIGIVVNEELDPVSVTTVNITLEDSGSTPVTGAVSYNAATDTITFDPDADLLPHEEYTVSVNALKDLANNAMSTAHTWTFTTINQAPTLSQAQVSPITGDDSTVFEYSVVFTDLDNDAPSTNISLFIDDVVPANPMSPNSSATADLMDGDFTNGESFVFGTTISTGGDHTYFFNATDGLNFHLTSVFDGPHVVTPNMPPVISDVPDQPATEDISLTFDMAPYISDPDNSTDDLEMNVTHQYLSFVVGFNATFLFTELANAQEDVVFTVTDGLNQVQKTVRFIVTKVDDPPVLSPIPDVTVDPGVEHIIDLMDHIEDIDTGFLDLSATTNSSYITVTDMNLTLNYTSDVSVEIVNVSVSDLTTTVYDEFEVTVRGGPVVNQPPVVDPLTSANLEEDEPFTYDLSNFITDDGLPSGILTVTEDSDHVSVSGLVLNMLYPEGVLSETITIVVSDGELSRTVQLEVVIAPVNDPPTLSNGRVDPSSTDVPKTYDFSVVYKDVDSPAPTVKVVIDGVEHTMTKLTGDHRTGITYEFELDNSKDLKKGTHTYKFIADDMAGAANSVVETQDQSFAVKKKGPKQDAPSGLEALLFPIIIVVIIAVVVIVLTVVMLKRRSGPATPPPQAGQVQPDLMAGPAQQPPPVYPPAEPPPQQPPAQPPPQQPPAEPVAPPPQQPGYPPQG